MTNHHNNTDTVVSHEATPHDATVKSKDFIDFRKLEIHRSVVKFFNSEEGKNFGFVTVLDDKDNKLYDAFLSGAVLEKAGIYAPLEKGTTLYIRHIPKDRGEAVVFVQKRPPVPFDESKNETKQTA